MFVTASNAKLSRFFPWTLSKLLCLHLLGFFDICLIFPIIKYNVTWVKRMIEQKFVLLSLLTIAWTIMVPNNILERWTLGSFTVHIPPDVKNYLLHRLFQCNNNHSSFTDCQNIVSSSKNAYLLKIKLCTYINWILITL